MCTRHMEHGDEDVVLFTTSLQTYLSLRLQGYKSIVKEALFVKADKVTFKSRQVLINANKVYIYSRQILIRAKNILHVNSTGVHKC